MRLDDAVSGWRIEITEIRIVDRFDEGIGPVIQSASNVSLPWSRVTVPVNAMGITPPCSLSRFSQRMRTWFGPIFWTLTARCFVPRMKLSRCLLSGTNSRKDTPSSGRRSITQVPDFRSMRTKAPDRLSNATRSCESSSTTSSPSRVGAPGTYALLRAHFTYVIQCPEGRQSCKLAKCPAIHSFFQLSAPRDTGLCNTIHQVIELQFL